MLLPGQGVPQDALSNSLGVFTGLDATTTVPSQASDGGLASSMISATNVAMRPAATSVRDDHRLSISSAAVAGIVAGVIALTLISIFVYWYASTPVT